LEEHSVSAERSEASASAAKLFSSEACLAQTRSGEWGREGRELERRRGGNEVKG
jgi:hypothetical protein